jgi:hypothetical protein
LRLPVESEKDAFRWVFGVTAVLLIGVVVGAVASPLYGVVLVAGAVLGVLAWELGTRDPTAASPLRDVARAVGRAPETDRHRVLVVANETVMGAELRAELIQRLEQSPEVRVVCPILPSRAHYIASDIDRELAEARERLDRTLAWAAEHRVPARGHVSAATPLEAVADELRIFPADEVIVSTHPPKRSKWLESGLVERLQNELDIPVHHVVVDLAQQPKHAGVSS